MQGMIRRTVQKQIEERLKAYPAVALVGPRQCGKTTLAQAMRGIYFDLEQGSDRLRLDLVLGFGKELWAVKVKLTSSPSTDDVAHLNKAADIIKASRRFLVSQTKKPAGTERCLSCNLPTFLEHLRADGS